jgi:hypothetical protein
MKVAMFVLILIFLTSGVFAVSGVSPGSYELDFEPLLEQEFVFKFIFDDGIKTQLYVEGALGNYVTLDKEELVGGGDVVVKLSLPSEVETPGSNLIRIGARQASEEKGGVGFVANVRGIIKINVPYPGKYVELDLKVPSANAGELVNISLDAASLGKEDVEISPLIQIFQDGDKIETIELGKAKITSSDSKSFSTILDTTNYLPGDYNVTALAEYEKGVFARDDDPFRLGELMVKILDYPIEFREDKIERFEIEVESLWNNQIEDLYAEVGVIGSDVSFITTSVGLRPWRKINLVGFLDTSDIDSEEFQVEIVLHYGGKTTSEVFSAKLILNYDYVPWLFSVVVLIIVGFLAWRIWIFSGHLKKNGKKSKISKK